MFKKIFKTLGYRMLQTLIAVTIPGIIVLATALSVPIWLCTTVTPDNLVRFSVALPGAVIEDIHYKIQDLWVNKDNPFYSMFSEYKNQKEARNWNSIKI